MQLKDKADQVQVTLTKPEHATLEKASKVLTLMAKLPWALQEEATTAYEALRELRVKLVAETAE